MKTANTTQESSPGYAEETRKKHYSEQTEMETVNDTPFTIVRIGTEWNLLMGSYLMVGNMESRLHALAEAKKMSWERIMQVIAVMMERYEVEKAKTTLKEKAEGSEVITQNVN